MKKLIVPLVALTLATSSLTSCSTNTQAQNTGAGAVTGGIVGGVASGLLGGNAVAIGLSAVAGALIGGYIGHSWDNSDNTAASQALSSNKTNMPSTWTNPKTGVVYRFTPTSGMITYHGNPNCRTYRADAVIDGKPRTSTGLACLQTSGAWSLMKN